LTRRWRAQLSGRSRHDIDLHAITAISAPPSDISSNGTQNSAIPDQHQIELVASFRTGTDMDKSIERE